MAQASTTGPHLKPGAIVLTRILWRPSSRVRYRTAVSSAPFDSSAAEPMTEAQRRFYSASQWRLMWWKLRRHRLAVLSGAFLLAACFPLLSLVTAGLVIREPRVPADRAALLTRLRDVRAALGAREVWLVAGFIFLFTFSPSFGPGFLFFQTDRLGFSQQFIGTLAALQSLGSVLGALTYAPISRRWPLRRRINVAIGLSVAAGLVYLLYRGPWSAALVDFAYGWVYMVTALAFLELAAKACPPHVEGTFFALLMSVYNAGMQGSQWVGGHLYDAVGFERLVLISAICSAVVWLLVPLVPIERIEARSREEAAGAGV